MNSVILFLHRESFHPFNCVSVIRGLFALSSLGHFCD